MIKAIKAEVATWEAQDKLMAIACSFGLVVVATLLFLEKI